MTEDPLKVSARRDPPARRDGATGEGIKGALYRVFATFIES
jgi:hypothetical protein